MEKNTKNRIEEKEKLEAEIARSYSVAEMKKAHSQIEEVEKTRRKPSVLSIIERIDNALILTNIILNNLFNHKKENEEFFSTKISENYFITVAPMAHYYQIYESLRFDFQKNSGIKEEDFRILFPRIKPSLDTANDIIYIMNGIQQQLSDMKIYCKRLI